MAHLARRTELTTAAVTSSIPMSHMLVALPIDTYETAHAGNLKH